MSTKVLNTLRWLFYEPRHFWLCVSVFLVAAFVVSRGDGAEPVVRITGMCLQLLGLGTVVWGIVKTRDFFGMVSPYRAFIEWLARFPLRARVVTGSARISGPGAGFFGRGYSSCPIDPSAPVEARTTALEKNVSIIHESIINLQAEFDHTTQRLNEQQDSEQQHRRALATELREHLKSYGTNGLHVSAIGAAWVFLGTLFSTASVEIAAFLN